MTAPDHDAIRATLYPHVLRFTDDAAYCDGECGWVAERFGTGAARGQWARHVGEVVAALMEDYAADLRAEVERLRGKWMDGYRAGRTDECAAAEADRDAYAAEKVREALLDAAKAIEACCSDDPGYNVGCRDAAGYLRNLAGAS